MDLWKMTKGPGKLKIEGGGAPGLGSGPVGVLGRGRGTAGQLLGKTPFRPRVRRRTFTPKQNKIPRAKNR